MRANEFVKEFGWGEAKVELIYCKCAPSGNLFYKNIGVSIADLKRLVEAWDLVQVGLPELKKAMFSDSKDLECVKNWVLTVSDKLLTEKGIKLKQAILDVESCQ